MFTRKLGRAAAAVVASMAIACGLLATSAVPAEAASKKITGVSKPKISGTKSVGKTLTGKPDKKVKPSGTKRTYQWLRSGKAIPGATSTKYTLTGSDRGKKISFTTCYTKSRYKKRCVTSKSYTIGYGVEKVTTEPTPDPEPSTPPAGPPTVTAVSPVSGPLAGGDTLTITGTNLKGATVTFRGDTTSARPTIAAQVNSSTATSITLTVPAGLGGKSVVTVTTAAGSATGSYTYITADRQLGSFEQQVIDEVNARRTASGGQVCGTTTYPAVPALPVNPKLNDVAQSHANDLGYRWATDYRSDLSHTTAGTTGSNIRFSAAGFKNPVKENTSVRYSSVTASELVNYWMASPSHCSTIMTPEAISIGVGTWTGRSAGQPQAVCQC